LKFHSKQRFYERDANFGVHRAHAISALRAMTRIGTRQLAALTIADLRF